MIEQLLQELKDLRNEMVQSNWPAQRISNIITIWEHKIQEQPEDEKQLERFKQREKEEQEALEEVARKARKELGE